MNCLIRVSTTSFLPRASSRIRPFGSRSSASVKVITDIDDTVKSSGGKKIFGIALGGIDTQYKRGTLYPGAFQFAFEISRNSTKASQSVPPKVSVLTARAREFKFALALKPTDKICSAYRSIGEKFGLQDWGVGDVYYGSVAEWIFQQRKGIRKFDNFEKMLKKDSAADPSCTYILVGDTGEKDEEAGERMAMKYPQRLRAIFLHSVTESKDRSSLRVPTDRAVNGVPVYYFKTYVGAALKAFQNKIITSKGLQRVIAQAQLDLQTIEQRKKVMLPPWLVSNQQELLIASRREEIEEDIREAMKVVRLPKAITVAYSSTISGRP